MQINLPMAESAVSAPRASFGEVELYPDLTKKVAVLGERIVATHPLPDGNRRTALLCMMEFTEINGHVWLAPDRDAVDGDETGEVMAALGAGEISSSKFAGWVSKRVSRP